MQNKEALKKRLEAIKKIKDLPEAISALADLVYEIGISSCEERVMISEEVYALKKIIVGNGDPTNSLLTKIRDLERAIAEFSKTNTLLSNAIIGTTQTGGTIKGLDKRLNDTNDRIDDIDRLNGNLVKVTWILVSAVILEILGRVFGLF